MVRLDGGGALQRNAALSGNGGAVWSNASSIVTVRLGSTAQYNGAKLNGGAIYLGTQPPVAERNSLYGTVKYAVLPPTDVVIEAGSALGGNFAMDGGALWLGAGCTNAAAATCSTRIRVSGRRGGWHFYFKPKRVVCWWEGGWAGGGLHLIRRWATSDWGQQKRNGTLCVRLAICVLTPLNALLPSLWLKARVIQEGQNRRYFPFLTTLKGLFLSLHCAPHSLHPRPVHAACACVCSWTAGRCCTAMRHCSAAAGCTLQ